MILEIIGVATGAIIAPAFVYLRKRFSDIETVTTAIPPGLEGIEPKSAPKPRRLRKFFRWVGIAAAGGLVGGTTFAIAEYLVVKYLLPLLT